MIEKMGWLSEDKKAKFKIETEETPKGDIALLCPERGIITSLKFCDSDEILYMDEETLNNKELNIKGGIPVLFPNAGPIPDELKTPEFASLKQHGFARDQKWNFEETMQESSLILRANSETKKVFPYDFVLSLVNKFEKDGSFTITEQVENCEPEREMPISMGLHPYFKVANELKKDIKFDFEGGKFIEDNFDKWANGKAVSLDNPGGSMVVTIPKLGKLTFNISKEFKKIWIWSQTDKDFICIEPVMRDKGGLVTDPEMIKPYERFSAKMNISFRKY